MMRYRGEAIQAGTSTDLDRLRRVPSVRLGRWPTPIEQLRPYKPMTVLVKRDDLSGYGRGGAKTRKIEHLIGHLVDRGYDELITVAGNVTNLVFDILPVLHDRGITPRLFILDDPPAARADRESIFRGVRKHVHFLGVSRAGAARAALASYAQSRAHGRRPFLLLPGLSHPAAVLGSARGFLEMAEQLRYSGGALLGSVFITVATGTTLAGFVLAEHALRQAGYAPIRVIGVQVYPGAARAWTLALIRWTERFLRLSSPVPRNQIEINTAALHGGFGRFPEALAALCERVLLETDVCLDPIFGGKTWSLMETFLRQRAVSDRPVLYWHCGYTPEWRALGRAVQHERKAAA